MMYSRSNIPRSTPTASRQGHTVHISPPRPSVVLPTTESLSAFSPPLDYNGTAFPYRDSEDSDNTAAETGIAKPRVQAKIPTDMGLIDEECDSETCPRYPIDLTYECDEDTCLPVIKFVPTVNRAAEGSAVRIPPPVPDDMEPFITRRRQISDDVSEPETNKTEEEGDEMQLLPQLGSLNVADDDMLLAALIILLLLSGAEEEIIMILAFLLLAK